MSRLVTAHALGFSALHCHARNPMDGGMFPEVRAVAASAGNVGHDAAR
ncbi:MAG: hypothetical protein K2X99_02660 [Gemmatimonadaceae bacterium]|nr:hypothetical protein [Gemmatimonadaceae bacterium]